MSCARRWVVVTGEYPPWHGGISRTAAAIATCLSTMREVRVVAPAYATASGSEHAEVLPVTRVAVGSSRSKLRGLAVAEALGQALAHTPADIVLCLDHFGAAAVTCARRRGALRGVRHACFAHGTDLLSVARRPWFRAGGAHRAYVTACSILANSRFTLGIARRSFPGTPSALAGLGLDPWWLGEPSDAEQATLDADLPAQPGRIIAMAGRLDLRKGHGLLIRAVAALPAQDRPLLVAAGNGPERERLTSLAGRLGVHLLIASGRSDAWLRALYRRADAMALAPVRIGTTVEGFGLVLLEAAAQGCPCFVRASGGAAEALAPGDLLLPANAGACWPALIAEALAVGRGDLARQNARRTWARGFGWPAVAQRILDATNG